jgi:hypothetical protein
MDDPPGETSGILPSLALNGFSLPSTSTTLRQELSPLPRIPFPPKRSGKRARPSTASSVEERASLLPSAPNGTIIEVVTPESSLERELVEQKGMALGAQNEATSAKTSFEKISHATLGVYSCHT